MTITILLPVQATNPITLRQRGWQYVRNVEEIKSIEDGDEDVGVEWLADKPRQQWRFDLLQHSKNITRRAK